MTLGIAVLFGRLSFVAFCWSMIVLVMAVVSPDWSISAKDAEWYAGAAMVTMYINLGCRILHNKYWEARND